MAGIIAGNGATSNVPGSLHVVRGVAPNANLIDMRVLNANGASSGSAVIPCAHSHPNALLMASPSKKRRRGRGPPQNGGAP